MFVIVVVVVVLQNILVFYNEESEIGEPTLVCRPREDISYSTASLLNWSFISNLGVFISSQRHQAGQLPKSLHQVCAAEGRF